SGWQRRRTQHAIAIAQTCCPSQAGFLSPACPPTTAGSSAITSPQSVVPYQSRKSRRNLSDHTIIQPPDCLFRRSKQSFFCAMNANVKPEGRLSILCAGDRFRRWNSLDDQRVCGVCGRKFKGRQIEIRRFSGGRYELYCPILGCPSGPQQWLYPRAPVVSEVAKPDWWRAGKQPARHSVESTPQAHGQCV